MLSKTRMLESLIQKYKNKPEMMALFKLSYAGKYIIIKAADVAGAIYHFKRGYGVNDEPSQSALDGIYGLFYRWVEECLRDNIKSRFTVNVCFRVGQKFFPEGGGPPQIATAFDLLKAEQKLLWFGQTDSACLNSNFKAYIPKWNPVQQMYGWFTKGEVVNFQKWYNDQERNRASVATNRRKVR